MAPNQTFSKMILTRDDGTISIENEFVKYIHSENSGYELSGAIVKYGSGKNLLVKPQSTSLSPWVRGGWRQYHHYETRNAKATNLEAVENSDGSCVVSFNSTFVNEKGEELPSALALHKITYKPNGRAEHELTIKICEDIDLGYISVGSLYVDGDFNRVAVRPSSMASWAVELQNPCQWIDLRHGKSRSDLPAYRSRFLPLSVLFLKNGIEAIEMSMGDDLEAWDRLGIANDGLAQGSVQEAKDPWHYEAIFAPLDSPRKGNIVKKGTYKISYSVALPHVKEHILPLSIAGAFIKATKEFKDRWPTKEDLAKAKEKDFTLQRLHNDGDFYGNGLFWHDVAYPPYPKDEMEKMDRAINDARSLGIDVVPYFSCKEWHPTVPPFDELGEKSARMVVKGESQMETFFGTSLFGVQMCLESDWLEVRKASIKKTLENHAFNGIYYDWCMGLECINEKHANHGRHWDNDKLNELLDWSRENIGDEGKLYLHLTNVPSLSIENLGSIALVEESEYFDIFPEMFTPQVHFLNVLPRSICLMLPGNAREEWRIRALALAALLNHATLGVGHEDFFKPALDLYKEKTDLIARFTDYKRHAAPGEGVATTSNSKEVGISVYWDEEKALALLANLSREEKTVSWQINLGNGRTYSGISKVPALDITTIEL